MLLHMNFTGLTLRLWRRSSKWTGFLSPDRFNPCEQSHRPSRPALRRPLQVIILPTTCHVTVTMINGNHVAVPTIQGRHNDHTESNGHALSTPLSRKIDINMKPTLSGKGVDPPTNNWRPINRSRPDDTKERFYLRFASAQPARSAVPAESPGRGCWSRRHSHVSRAGNPANHRKPRHPTPPCPVGPKNRTRSDQCPAHPPFVGQWYSNAESGATSGPI